MRIRWIALLLLLAALLSGCGYWVVEENPVQIGSPTVQESTLQ